jgi:hypothetical protein
MLNMKNRKSPIYMMGIFLPRIIGIFINLYGLISQSSSKYITIVSNIFLILMFFNLGIREIIHKHKTGYWFLLIVVTMLVLLYRHNR